MPDELEHFGLIRPPNPERPLQGMTVLVVEDSRFASEAIRLLCLRSGARIRRADTLAAAYRHLAVYRPTIVIIDLGLPDGCGSALIEELAQAQPRVGVIIAMSGDDTSRERAMDAGADGFLAKPIESLFAFQAMVLRHLPVQESADSPASPVGPRLVSGDLVAPDRISFKDDLSHIAQVIGAGPRGKELDYIAQFLVGVAKSAHDHDLEAAAMGLARARAAGLGTRSGLASLAGLIEQRLETGSVV